MTPQPASSQQGGHGQPLPVTVTRVQESIVVKAPLPQVWRTVRDGKLSFWSSAIKQSEVESNAAPELVEGTRRFHFHDGTDQRVKVVAFSELDHCFSYEVIASTPPTAYTSALHTMRLRPITHDQTTFVEWSAEFSGDATAEVIEDAKYKKKDGLVELAKKCAGGK